MMMSSKDKKFLNATCFHGFTRVLWFPDVVTLGRSRFSHTYSDRVLLSVYGAGSYW